MCEGGGWRAAGGNGHSGSEGMGMPEWVWEKGAQGTGGRGTMRAMGCMVGTLLGRPWEGKEI